MQLTTEAIAQATAATVTGPPVRVDGATQDSRQVRPGQLFVPLVAERDGHDFIARAVEQGAAAYLTSRPPQGGTAIEVSDTSVALSALGGLARSMTEATVIGITGSVGKTSTKDLLASALATTHRTHASERSFNNEIGVPLTLLNTPDDAEVLVVEMGARGIGHIADLCEIARPTVGIVTTVAAAHTGEFGSTEAIALAKGELVESLPTAGAAVLNADDELVWAMRERTGADLVPFGRTAASGVRLTMATVDDDLRLRVVLETDWGRLEAAPAVRGVHLASNVAASAAAALWCGVPSEAVARGLETAAVSPWRMEVARSKTGALVVNDAYNANPTSMLGALDSLAAVDAGRKLAVLGYMAELADEARAHLEVRVYAESLGIEVVAVGTDLYGLEPTDAPVARIGVIDADTAVLVKGSRVAGLEAVAADLLG